MSRIEYYDGNVKMKPFDYYNAKTYGGIIGEGTKVLCPLGAGDIDIYAKCLGADVTSFYQHMINVYYWYLKKWIILFNYPINRVINGNIDLSLILNDVIKICSNKQEFNALMFWLDFYQKGYKLTNIFSNNHIFNDSLWNNITDKEKGAVKLPTRFIEMKSTSLRQFSEDPFDIVITSNIFEMRKLFASVDKYDEIFDIKGIIKTGGFASYYGYYTCNQLQVYPSLAYYPPRFPDFDLEVIHKKDFSSISVFTYVYRRKR